MIAIIVMLTAIGCVIRSAMLLWRRQFELGLLYLCVAITIIADYPNIREIAP